VTNSGDVIADVDGHEHPQRQEVGGEEERLDVPVGYGQELGAVGGEEEANEPEQQHHPADDEEEGQRSHGQHAVDPRDADPFERDRPFRLSALVGRWRPDP
jgi:hypothetical protein